MVNTRNQTSQSAPQEQPSSDHVLAQILTAIQGLTQASMATQNTMQNVMERLPGLVTGNGAASSAAGPSGTPDEEQGRNRERVNLGDSTVRIGVPDPVPPVINRVVQSITANDGDKYTLEKFRKNGAEVFIGATDPMKAESWIDNMEKSFKAMSVPHRHQTRLATCMLQEEASQWWKSLERGIYERRAIDSITWAEFVEVFNRQYFPEPIRQRKALEFSALTQGEGSVLEYSKKFLALGRFAPGVVTSEKAKAEKFFWGLKAEIRDKIAVSPRNTISEVVDAATTQEMVMDYDKSTKQTKVQPLQKPLVSTPNNNRTSYQQQQTGNKRKWEDTSFRKCRNCGKMHSGVCRDPLRCFNCGRQGHFQRNCRLPPKQNDGPDWAKAPANKPNSAPATPAEKGKAKLNAMEVKEEDDVGAVRGTISIKAHRVNALFDSGCTHSFVSSHLVKSLGLPTYRLPKSFRITAATEASQVTRIGVRELSVDIQGSVYKWDFVVYELKDYDIILGMDWLSAHQAFLDCENKRVVHKDCKCETRVVYQGQNLGVSSCIVSVGEEFKILGEGYEAIRSTDVEVGVRNL